MSSVSSGGRDARAMMGRLAVLWSVDGFTRFRVGGDIRALFIKLQSASVRLQHTCPLSCYCPRGPGCVLVQTIVFTNMECVHPDHSTKNLHTILI